MACERTLGLLIILPTRLFFSFMTSLIGAGKIGMSLAFLIESNGQTGGLC